MEEEFIFCSGLTSDGLEKAICSQDKTFDKSKLPLMRFPEYNWFTLCPKKLFDEALKGSEVQTIKDNYSWKIQTENYSYHRKEFVDSPYHYLPLIPREIAQNRVENSSLTLEPRIIFGEFTSELIERFDKNFLKQNIFPTSKIPILGVIGISSCVKSKETSTITYQDLSQEYGL